MMLCLSIDNVWEEDAEEKVFTYEEGSNRK
jgi:hypothetical protein